MSELEEHHPEVYTIFNMDFVGWEKPLFGKIFHSSCNKVLQRSINTNGWMTRGHGVSETQCLGWLLSKLTLKLAVVNKNWLSQGIKPMYNCKILVRQYIKKFL